MKRLVMTVTACLLALMTAALSPLQALAAADSDTEKYISEVKIGMGKSSADAAAALNGYKILSDKNGGNVDLNQKAGGGWGSKGEKVVYLGYKTTDDSTDAITDLAVMNMKGGYSVQDYDALMNSYIEKQIEPMLDRFVDAIEEYRANFSSDIESNRLRAVYIHDILNKFIDDDTGKGLGDLLLNRTKYEMGDEAYNALSDAQKNSTADIVTIFAQCNGKLLVTVENLLTRAADTSEDTWLDRLAEMSYDDLIDEAVDQYGNMTPTDAEKMLAAVYEDDARKILALWSDFSARLGEYDQAVEQLESFDYDSVQQRIEELNAVIQNEDGSLSEEELQRAIDERTELIGEIADALNNAKLVGICDRLDEIGYGDGTLLDFFSRNRSDVDLKELYPVAAALSDGQKAGIDFISLLELVAIAMTSGEDYSDSALDELESVSLYEGVDREIYRKGGVGLTNAAWRDKAASRTTDEESMLSGTTKAMCVISGIFAVALIGAIVYAKTPVGNAINGLLMSEAVSSLKDNIRNGIDVGKNQFLLNRMTAPGAFGNYLVYAIGAITVVLSLITVIMTYNDLVEYYNVEFTPIPRYMVDEKDITAYNSKGEKIVIKNQTAYYKAVECNRAETDERFGMLGTCADLNGDVGKQWLALYAVKNEAMSPILADSLMATVDDDRLPANYTTGIHMFGSDTAFNLNDHAYVWEGEAPSVYVYFNTERAAGRSAFGSMFADGAIALAGGIGMIVGAFAVCAMIPLARKKKED